jgi:DNA-binding response OmpR family regulator
VIRSDSTPSILVIDDNPLILKGMVRLLEKAGYFVLSAADGESGIERALENKPDLVLSDVILPAMDGLAVCHQIKTNPALQDCYVILISGLHTSSEEQAIGLETGADGYIARPISNRELVARVDAMLRLRNAEIALRQNQEQYAAEETARHRRELSSYDIIAVSSRNGVGTRQTVAEPLKQREPDIFAEIVATHTQILEQAVKQRAVKTDHDLSIQLHALSDQLGSHWAGPRDIVDIHKQALNAKHNEEVPIEQLQTYLEEGRLILIELMGNLVRYYRALSTNQSPAGNWTGKQSS